MCAAVGLPMPLTFLKSQQTRPFAALRWRRAIPEPAAGPFVGASALPVSFADTTGLIAVPPASARAGRPAAAMTASGTNRRLFMSLTLLGSSP